MTKVSPQMIVNEARTWTGTRFHHQAALKGVGVDCVGLIIGTAAAFDHKADPEQFRRFKNYAKLPNPARMVEALTLFLDPVPPDQMQLADILYLQWREHLPTHLAFFAEFGGRPTIIHALAEVGKVVEHGYIDPWPSRLHSVWRLRIAEKIEPWQALDSELPAPH